MKSGKELFISVWIMHKKKWPETIDALKRSHVHNHTQNGSICGSVIKIPPLHHQASV